MQGSKPFGRSWKVWFIPAVATLFAAGLAGEAKSTDRLPELMELTGLDKAFDYVGAGIKAGVKQTLPNSPMSAALREKVLAGVEPAADAAFAPGTLRREFGLAMAGKLSSADFDRIFAFHKSPLGARMTALEKASQGAAVSGQLAKMAGELLERLKNEPPRAEVYKLMDSSLRLTEITTGIAFKHGPGSSHRHGCCRRKDGGFARWAIAAIDSALEKMRPAMTAQMKEQILLSLAYTYRDASIPELRKYLVFLTSPAGKRFYGAIVPAMNKVFVKAGGEFGHALMRELGKERT